jgi:NADH-quinone oxidoreductase subunit N
VATDDGVEAALFYLATYTFLVAGSFGVVTLVGRRGDAHHALTDYRGLARRRPGLALVLTVFLLAQAGVPLTSGFFAKFYVITAAVEGGSTSLAIVAMLSSVIAAFLYLRIVASMFMTDPEEDAAGSGAASVDSGGRIAVPVGAGLALGLCLLVTLGVGVWPGFITDAAHDAVPVLSALG